MYTAHGSACSGTSTHPAYPTAYNNGHTREHPTRLGHPQANLRPAQHASTDPVPPRHRGIPGQIYLVSGHQTGLLPLLARPHVRHSRSILSHRRRYDKRPHGPNPAKRPLNKADPATSGTSGITTTYGANCACHRTPRSPTQQIVHGRHRAIPHPGAQRQPISHGGVPLRIQRHPDPPICLQSGWPSHPSLHGHHGTAQTIWQNCRHPHPRQ